MGLASPKYQALPEGKRAARGTWGLLPPHRHQAKLVAGAGDFPAGKLSIHGLFWVLQAVPQPTVPPKSAARRETLPKGRMGCGWTQRAPKSRRCWFVGHSWDGKGQWSLPRAVPVYKATLSVQALLLVFFFCFINSCGVHGNLGLLSRRKSGLRFRDLGTVSPFLPLFFFLIPFKLSNSSAPVRSPKLPKARRIPAQPKAFAGPERQGWELQGEGKHKENTRHSTLAGLFPGWSLKVSFPFG